MNKIFIPSQLYFIENYFAVFDNVIMVTKDRLKNIGINIKSERLRRGISQEELAEKCDISRNSVSLIETGKINPTILRVVDIAKVLKVDIASLVKGV